MANILNNAAYMALPMNIKRGNPIPLDTTAVWYAKADLEDYAKTGATALSARLPISLLSILSRVLRSMLMRRHLLPWIARSLMLMDL